MSNATRDPNEVTTETQETPEYVSKADLSQIISQAVNAAVSSHLKRALPKALEQLTPAKVEADATTSTEVPAWQKEIDSLKRQVAEEKKLRKETALRAATERATSELSKELSASGKLRQEAIPVVVELLTKAQNRLVVEEDGSARYQLSPDDVVSLQEGAKAFLTSKDAQHFIAAPIPQNSRPGSRAPIASERVDPSDPAKATRRDLISQLTK